MKNLFIPVAVWSLPSSSDYTSLHRVSSVDASNHTAASSRLPVIPLTLFPYISRRLSAVPRFHGPFPLFLQFPRTPFSTSPPVLTAGFWIHRRKTAILAASWRRSTATSKSPLFLEFQKSSLLWICSICCSMRRFVDSNRGFSSPRMEW